MWSGLARLLANFVFLTFECLFLPLFFFRLDGIKDGGSNQQISECTHNKTEGANVLLLHITIFSLLEKMTTEVKEEEEKAGVCCEDPPLQ